MFEKDVELVEKLRKEDEEFDRLFMEHQALEKQLEEISELKFPNPQEELEKKRLQKIKLSGKDRMAEILLSYKEKNLC